MALPSSDPKVLLGNAKCWSCLTTTYQLRVETYFLATLVGVSTTAAGVASLSASATCFGCLTNPQLKAVKAYLMALTTGAATDAAGVRALAQSAKCWDCLTPKQRLQVEVYLFAVSAGNATDVSGVRSATAAAKCFSCLETKQLYEVQVYLLSLIAPGAASSPSDLLAAAKCFVECLTPGELSTVASNVAARVASIATPPCVTPTAPTSAGFKTKTNTTISISWSQPANTGSLITGYTISWGTTLGGPYPNSATVAASPRLYTITGLTQGTQYFWVIQANSFAGCSSANSAESNTTTNGAAPTNGLLNGLVSYWALATSPSSPDLEDGNPSTVSGGVFNANGGAINNGPYASSFGGLNTGYAIVPSPANLRLGNGASFTCQLWIKPDAVQGNAIASVVSQWNNVAATNSFICYINAGNFRMSVYSTDVTVQDFLIAANPGNAAWHHLIVGYNSATKQAFAQFDGGARVTQATSADLNSVVTGFAHAKSGFAGTECGCAVNESGFWNRVLSTTDVANLYNAGAGLPFSSFQA